MPEDSSQTEWSGAPLTNKRIHDIREMIRMVTNNPKEWIMLLELLNHELYGFESAEEQVSLRSQINKLSDMIISYKPKVLNKNISMPPEVINGLNDIYYQLDLIFHKSGLQTYIKEEAGDAF
jgi:hypothetical protein